MTASIGSVNQNQLRTRGVSVLELFWISRAPVISISVGGFTHFDMGFLKELAESRENGKPRYLLFYDINSKYLELC